MTVSPENSVIEKCESKPQSPEISGITPIKICFVCTGNTCRSPMAAALLNFLGKGMYSCSSAGIMPNVGENITPNAEAALVEFGVPNTKDNDYIHHKSRRISEEIFEENDRIVGVSLGHARMLLEYFPQYAHKIGNLSTPISDPYGGNLENYKKCLSDIHSALTEDFIIPEEK